jgi:CO/xanthine dehydrogenase FAD-binding subunit
MDLTTIADVVVPGSRADIPLLAAGDALLAGGTWVFSEPQLSLRRLVDLTALGWPALHADASGLTISATCRIAELFGWAPPLAWPAGSIIPDCCHCLLGSFKIWNAATVGGNICLALPAGPMTALTAALDGVATIWTADGGEREARIPDLVIGDNRNSLARGEIMRSVFLPAATLARQAAFRQMSLSPVGRSAALLIATAGPAGDLALTITAATPHPIRLDFAAMPSAAILREAIETTVTTPKKWFDDIHGAPDWRRHITLHLAEDLRRELGGGI